MSLITRDQKMAEAAYRAVSVRNRTADYNSFAKSFPALIHSCGLCQSMAFALAKKKTEVVADVLATLNAAATSVIADVNSLASQVRTAPLSHYLRLSRLALDAAIWVKRYVEALDAQVTEEDD